MSSDGWLYGLAVTLETAPGAGNFWDFVLLVNGSPSAMTVRISDAATTGAYSGTEIYVRALDKVCIRITPDSGPTACTCSFTTLYTSTTAGTWTLMGGGSDTNSQRNTLGCGVVGNTQDYRSSVLLPLAGTVKNFRAKLVSAPGNGYTSTLSVKVNAAAPANAPTVVIANLDTYGSDTVKTASISAGNYINGNAILTAGGTSGILWESADFTPTTAGLFPVAMNIGYNGLLDTVNNMYASPAQWAQSYLATIAEMQQRCGAGTLKSFYVRLHDGQTPGAGQYKFTVYKNSNPTALTVTLAGAVISGNVSSDVAVSDGDLLAIYIEPSGGPTSCRVIWGISMT